MSWCWGADEQMNRWKDEQMSRWADNQMDSWAEELMLMQMLMKSINISIISICNIPDMVPSPYQAVSMCQQLLSRRAQKNMLEAMLALWWKFATVRAPVVRLHRMVVVLTTLGTTERRAKPTYTQTQQSSATAHRRWLIFWPLVNHTLVKKRSLFFSKKYWPF